MIWNQEQKNKIYDLINVDLDDPTLKSSLITFRYASIPQGIRDIAQAVVEGQDISDIEKKMKIKGIYALYPECSQDEISNPDFLASSEFLTAEDINKIYSASLAMSISTQVFSKEVQEKYPNIALELKDPDNATEFLGLVNEKILNELGCNKLIHEIFYPTSKTPNIPIPNLKDFDGLNNKRINANKVLNETYSKIMMKLKKTSKDKFSSEAMTTIYCYGVLREIEKIENSANFKHYSEKQVDKSGLTWGDVLSQLKDYIHNTYLPINAFNMPKEIANFQTTMKKYREEMTKRAELTGQTISQTSKFKDPSYYKDKELVHIHHIFKHSDFEELANQKSNFLALDPTTHYSYAHPENNTQITDPQFQQYALLVKFLDKDTLLYSRNGWKELGLYNVIDKALGSNFCEKYGEKGIKPTFVEFVNELAKWNPEYTQLADNECIVKTLLAQSYEKTSYHNISYSDLVKSYLHFPNQNIKSDFFMDIAKTFMFEDEGTTQKIVNVLIEDLEAKGLSKDKVVDALINDAKNKINKMVLEDSGSITSSELNTSFIIGETIASIAIVQNLEDWNHASSPELTEINNILKEQTKIAYTKKALNTILKENLPTNNSNYLTLIGKISENPNKYLTPKLCASLAFIPEDSLEYGKFNYVKQLYEDLHNINPKISKESFIKAMTSNINTQEDWVLANCANELIKQELGVDTTIPPFKDTQSVYDKYDSKIKELYPTKSLEKLLKQDPEFLPPQINNIIENYNNDLENASTQIDVDVDGILYEQKISTIEMFISPIQEDLSFNQYKEYQSEYIKEQLQDLFNYTPTKEMANDIFDLITKDTNFDDGLDKFVQVVSCYGVNSINEVIQDYDYILDNIQIEI